MRTQQFNAEQFDAVMAIIVAVRQIVTSGEVPQLRNGWRIGSPQEANYYNDIHMKSFVALGHQDMDVLRAARAALSGMGMLATGIGLNVSQFIFAQKPGYDS